MTIRESYRYFVTALNNIYEKGEAEAITRIIFEQLLHADRSFIIRNPEQILSEENEAALEMALQKLISQIPVQYVTGIADFLGLQFEVNPTVLIPRPETEELVKLAVGFLENSTTKRILEIGTGSGCIAVGIRKYIKPLDFIGIDVSASALEVARRNAFKHEVDIDFRLFDFLQQENWNTLGKFDLIVSNPPYIPLSEKNNMPKNVTEFEPHLALFVGDDDPLIFYKAISAFGKQSLNKDGIILLETHEALAKEVADIFKTEFNKTDIIKDWYGKDRIVVVQSRKNHEQIQESDKL